MRDEYDFTNAVKNPYAATLKEQDSVRVDAETIAYFKDMEKTTGIPYDKLINLCLSDCVRNHRTLAWG